MHKKHDLCCHGLLPKYTRFLPSIMMRVVGKGTCSCIHRYIGSRLCAFHWNMDFESGQSWFPNSRFFAHQLDNPDQRDSPSLKFSFLISDFYKMNSHPSIDLLLFHSKCLTHTHTHTHTHKCLTQLVSGEQNWLYLLNVNFLTINSYSALFI